MKIRAEDGVGPDAHHRGDANFTWRDFADTCNADLIKNYGNLVHRTFDLTHKYCNGSIDMSKQDKVLSGGQSCALFTKFDIDPSFQHQRLNLIQKCESAFDHNLISTAIWAALELSTLINKFITQSDPWKLYKLNPNDPEVTRIIGTSLAAVWSITKMLHPLIPKTTTKVLSFIQLDNAITTVKSGFTPFFSPIKL